MSYSVAVLERVRELGKMNFSIDDVVEEINPINKIAFQVDLEKEDSILRIMYLSGSSENESKNIELSLGRLAVQIEQSKVDIIKTEGLIYQELFSL